MASLKKNVVDAQTGVETIEDFTPSIPDETEMFSVDLSEVKKLLDKAKLEGWI